MKASVTISEFVRKIKKEIEYNQHGSGRKRLMS